jgi:signal transduction histidine kinase
MMRARRPMSVTVRLTLAFCIAMAAVLLLVATFVVALQRRSMDGAIRSELRQRYDDVRNRRPDAANQASHALLTARQLARGRRSVHVPAVPPPGSPRTLRVLVGPDAGNGVIVVATNLSARNESLDDLIQLLVGGGIVVLLAGGGLAFWLARVAIAPVDELVEQLHASVDRERAFVADAGHELRTPLALLAGEVELALDSVTDEEHRSTLERLQRDTQRLTTLAEDLLSMTSAAGGARRDVDVRDVVTTVVERLPAGPTGTRPDVALHIDRDLAVHVDPGQFERVVANLLENAVRHAATDVEVSAHRVDDSDLVELQVRDHGAGFADGFEAIAFERFTRADASRTGPGSGLGLAIVETIVHAHGGSVRAANAETGTGAVVSVQLPAASG